MLPALAPTALRAAPQLLAAAGSLFRGSSGSSSSSAGGHLRWFSAAAAPANAMALVKELRQISGAPISDVKSCLAASGWDMEAALEGLRLKGLAAAVKKASRHASEGLVATAQQGPGLVAVVEVNSETDFVGRSVPFQQLVSAAAAAALGLAQPVAAAAAGVTELEVQQLAAAALPGGGSSVEEGCAGLAGQVRENIALRRGFLVSGGQHGVVSSYVHMPVAPGAGRIAAVVALQPPAAASEAVQSELSQLGSNLAMHAAGMNTQFISQQHMPDAVLQQVRSDFLSQTQATLVGKPADVLARIVDGKVAKWCKESCLLEQPFVLDDSLTVAQLLREAAKRLQLPGPLQVAALLRVQVGEGLARQEEKPDFAAEVAAMAGTAAPAAK